MGLINRIKLDTFLNRYKELENELWSLRRQLDHLNQMRLRDRHFVTILRLDEKLANAAHAVLDIQMDVEVAKYEAKEAGIKVIEEQLEILLGNIVRLQESFLSLQRMNTNYYLRFSCYFAISIAIISLVIGVIPLVEPLFNLIKHIVPIPTHSEYSMLFQVILNGFVSASIYLLIAYSFSIIYSIGKVFYFSHGIIITIGAYSVLFAQNTLGRPSWQAICLGVLTAAILGCLINISVYQPLRQKGSSPLVQMLASLGIYIILQNVISLVFGDYAQAIRPVYVSEGYNICGAKLTIIQILTIPIGILLPFGCWLFMKWTKIGQSIRAVATSAELSSISGVYHKRVFTWAFIIGSGLAGLAGIVIAWDVDMVPTMGMTYLLMGIVVLIVGGIRSFWGMAFGAVLLSFAQHFGSIFIGVQWQTAIAFIILLIFLLLKPEGFMGKKLRTSTV